MPLAPSHKVTQKLIIFWRKILISQTNPLTFGATRGEFVKVVYVMGDLVT